MDIEIKITLLHKLVGRLDSIQRVLDALSKPENIEIVVTANRTNVKHTIDTTKNDTPKYQFIKVLEDEKTSTLAQISMIANDLNRRGNSIQQTNPERQYDVC